MSAPRGPLKTTEEQRQIQSSQAKKLKKLRREERKKEIIKQVLEIPQQDSKIASELEKGYLEALQRQMAFEAQMALESIILMMKNMHIKTRYIIEALKLMLFDLSNLCQSNDLIDKHIVEFEMQYNINVINELGNVHHMKETLRPYWDIIPDDIKENFCKVINENSRDIFALQQRYAKYMSFLKQKAQEGRAKAKRMQCEADSSKAAEIANNIISRCAKASEAINQFDCVDYGSIKEKYVALEKKLSELTAERQLLKQTLDEAKKYHSLAENRFDPILSSSNKEQFKIINASSAVIAQASNVLSEFDRELKKFNDNHLTSFSHSLIQRGANALDYLAWLQNEYKLKIQFKGGFAIKCGVHHYHAPDCAKLLKLKDIDGTIYADDPDEFVKRLPKNFDVTRREQVSEDDKTVKYINVMTVVDGVPIDLTIANANCKVYERNQRISALSSLAEAYILDEKEYNEKEYDLVEKKINNYLIAIKKTDNDEFERACRGKLEGYNYYNPDKDDYYCYLLLRSHLKSMVIKGKDYKDFYPVSPYLTYDVAIEDLKEKFINLLISKNDKYNTKPDREIGKLLREIKAINVDTLPFIKVYCYALVKYQMIMKGLPTKDEVLTSMANDISSNLAENYIRLMSNVSDPIKILRREVEQYIELKFKHLRRVSLFHPYTRGEISNNKYSGRPSP